MKIPFSNSSLTALISVLTILSDGLSSQTNSNGPILGMLEHYDSDYIQGHWVRVLFRKDNDVWKSFKHDFYTPEALRTSNRYFPDRMKWFICFDGKCLGSLVSKNLDEAKFYMSIGMHQIESNQNIPKIGKPDEFFSGFAFTNTYRPLVLNSTLNYSDPDKWKPFKPTAMELKHVKDFVKRHFGISDSLYSLAKFELNKSYKSSSRNMKLISVSVSAIELIEHVDESDYPESELWCLIQDEQIKYLKSEMRLLDAGDYDADGKSEVIFKIQKYNHDGYVLFYHDFQKSAEFGWNYH